MTNFFLMNGKITMNNLGTQGITGLPFLSVHSDGMIWHLDVGLLHPRTERGSKG